MIRMNKCILDISTWVAANNLKLNCDKTEVMFFGPSLRMRKASDYLPNTVQILQDPITVSRSVSNLGYAMDSVFYKIIHISQNYLALLLIH